MPFQKIAIAGASGYLGRKILEHLLTLPGIIHITVLSRSPQPAEAVAKQLVSFASISSYEDTDCLAAILRGHDVLISAIAGAAAGIVDSLLVDAAIRAGVKRFMPSEYTVDVLHPHSIEFAESTILAAKIANAKTLQLLAKEGKIEYTTLVTGPFLDFWFSGAVKGVVDLEERRVMLYDGGEHQVTGCSSDFISRCVGAVLTTPEDITKNQRIRIAEVHFSGKELLCTFEEVTGKQWVGIHKTTDALVDESVKAMEERNMRGFYLGQILKLAFDGEGSCDFEEGMMHEREAIKRLALKDIISKSLVSK
ncbi:NAD(P)-binding protein [Acephala macrosclerotiorum]|nr:NAD(P)-binding protein [Acephala macrosclerotiorum]